MTTNIPTMSQMLHCFLYTWTWTVIPSARNFVQTVFPLILNHKPRSCHFVVSTHPLKALDAFASFSDCPNESTNAFRSIYFIYCPLELMVRWDGTYELISGLQSIHCITAAISERGSDSTSSAKWLIKSFSSLFTLLCLTPNFTAPVCLSPIHGAAVTTLVSAELLERIRFTFFRHTREELKTRVSSVNALLSRNTGLSLLSYG